MEIFTCVLGLAYGPHNEDRGHKKEHAPFLSINANYCNTNPEEQKPKSPRNANAYKPNGSFAFVNKSFG